MVYLSTVRRLRCAKTTRRIEVLFKVETFGTQDTLHRGGGEMGEMLSIVKYRNIACIRCDLRQITLAFCRLMHLTKRMLLFENATVIPVFKDKMLIVYCVNREENLTLVTLSEVCKHDKMAGKKRSNATFVRAM